MKQKTFIGVIGGSGIYQLDGAKKIATHKVETPFGETSSDIIEMSLENKGEEATFYFLSRHGVGHSLMPSEINYRANIFALKKLGVDHLISISAVGSLKEELAPRSFVLPSQFIDWTKGKRERSFFGEGMVGHVSTALPVESALQKRIAEICREVKVPTFVGGSYICIEGPQFSSKAESEIYRSFGASVIGMTNVPESYLAKEAGMAYATMAMVTDYDCWKEEHCEVTEIMKVMADNYHSATAVLKKLIPSLALAPIEYVPENQFAVVTPKDNLNARHLGILEVILGEES